MKHKRIVLLPVLFVAAAVLLLAAVSFYIASQGHASRLPAGQGEHVRRPGGESGEIFNTFGTLAVLCGAVSFSWMRFKKRMNSPSPLVKTVSRILRKLHTFTGWSALGLIAVHGTYFLFTKLQDSKIYTGLAAFLILAALASYGWFIKRVRNKYVRKGHFLLSLLWLPLLLLHAGGSFIATAGTTAALWGVLWWAERLAQPGASVDGQRVKR